jgi:hypothetical protein
MAVSPDRAPSGDAGRRRTAGGRIAGLLLAFVAVAGCAPPLCVPSPVWAPLHESRGEVRVDGGFGTAGVGAIASVSPVDGVLVFAGIDTEAAAGDTSYGRSRRVRGAGLGVYRALGRGRALEGLVGFDAGRVSSFGSDLGGVEALVTSGLMRRGYAQVDVGGRRLSWLWPGLWGTAALSLRASGVSFSDLTESTGGQAPVALPDASLVVIEPGVLSGFLVGPARFESGFRIALPLGRPEQIDIEPMRVDIRLSVAIDSLVRAF